MANEFELSFQGSGNLYVILRRSEDATVWNQSDFVSWSDEDIASYALPLIHRGGDIYQGDFPGEIPPGQYRILYYQRAGESPATDDLLLCTRSFHWQIAEPGEEEEPVAVSADALTSVEAVARYLRLTNLTTDQEALLASLVNQVSARIERICGRRFHARDWVDRCARASGGSVLLRCFPVLSIERITAGSQESLRVKFTAADALAASVAVVFQDTGQTGVVGLRSISSTGQETITQISLETYPTTSLLAAAINDLPGWSATVTRNTPSSQLHEMGAIGALHREVPLMCPAQDLLWWDLDSATGRLNLWQSIGRVVVAYRAGYETIPADLQLAATELVAQAYQQGRQNPAVKSETLGDYSYTLATQTQISDDLWSRLRLYMEVR